MRLLSLLSAGVVASLLLPLAPASAVLAQNPPPRLHVGLLLPASPAPQAGVIEGAQLGADEARQAAQLLGGDVTLVVRSAGTDADAAARALVREAGVSIVIGGYDAASFAALQHAADQHAVLFLNVGNRADKARQACHPLRFHVVASERMAADAESLWRATARGESGAEVLLWHGALERFGAGQLNDRYRLRFGHPMNGAAWTAWMAVKIAWEGAARARSTDGATIARFLASPRARFDGHKGVELSFRSWDHQLRHPLHVRAAGSDGPPDDVPRAAPGEELAPRELLDRIGARAEGDGCTA